MFFTVIGALISALFISSVVTILGTLAVDAADQHLSWSELTLLWIVQILVMLLLVWLQAKYLLPAIVSAKVQAAYAVTGMLFTAAVLLGLTQRYRDSQSRVWLSALPGLATLVYVPISLVFTF